jgi:hypothetical protein
MHVDKGRISPFIQTDKQYQCFFSDILCFITIISGNELYIRRLNRKSMVNNRYQQTFICEHQ